jgi:outer membrane lipoprotein-sorting protein
MKKSFIFFAMFFMSIAPQLANAQNAKQARAEDIERAEQYLKDMKTAQARFVQTTHNGQQLVGTFYLSRPGKLRFEYDPPVENFVVADGTFIYFYDAELDEQTNAPIQATLANFFLRENFSLSDDLVVKEAKEAGGLLMITVVQADEPTGGSITFAFGKKPFELKKWRVVDGQGMITEVELFYLKTGMKHDSNLFYYIDPKKLDNVPSYND